MSVLVTSTPNPWMQILGALEKKVNRHSYDTWFKPTRFSHDADNKLFVAVPSPEFCTIGERYNDLILEAIEKLGLTYDDVEFVTAPAEPEPAAAIMVRAGRRSGAVPLDRASPAAPTTIERADPDPSRCRAARRYRA